MLSSLISDFALQGSLNFYNKCHKAGKHFQTMGKGFAGNYLYSCRAQEMWWWAWNTQSCGLHTKSRDRLIPCVLTEQQDRAWGSDQPRKQEENTAVVSAAVRNCINRVAKQDLNKGWQRGEWHILWEGPSRCVRLREHSCIPDWKGRHCPGSMRERKWRDRAGPLKVRQTVNAGGDSKKPQQSTKQQQGGAEGQIERIHS